MPYCLNPNCKKPNNLNFDAGKFCIYCGKNLQLKGLYEAIAIVGQGGMGRTFRGRDLGRLGQPCAIKQFFPLQIQNPMLMQKAIALFESEAAQLKKLGSHPQIPELIAYFAEDGYLYLVQELIEGENLGSELQNKSVFTEIQIYELLDSLLPVLQFIHDRQVIHRDIKPDNIIRRSPDLADLNRTNQDDPHRSSFVLVDFGAAKTFDDGINRTGTLIGSAEYIAPEQSRGKALPQSDLYSLGVTCIYLLTGISPFDLYDDASDRWIWQKKLQVSISPHLVTILNRLLEKAIAKRYQSASQVLADLHSNLRSKPQSTISFTEQNQASLLAQLQETLNLGQWREGDQLTNRIILELAHKRKISELSATDIRQIPCEIYTAIDQAWHKSSNDRFGWSTQKQIWQSLGGKLVYSEDNYWQFARTYEKFADRLKWRKSLWLPTGLDLPLLPRVWRKRKSLTFEIAAPRGHLPSLLFWEGFNLVDPIFYRLEICEQGFATKL